jgi:uncharacterized NAD-dependent epimerase/dehydratase family protein
MSRPSGNFTDDSTWQPGYLFAAMKIPTLQLRSPYLLFLGTAEDEPVAKTALGVRDWAPERCLAQMRLPGCQVDLGLQDMTPLQAARAGAGSLLLGLAPAGGVIPESWYPILQDAVAAGLDIVSGLHSRLANIPGLAAAAEQHGVSLVDVRHPRMTFPTASGRRRSGMRLLMVGTDCALGKKYTALALTRALRKQGINADFRATGQTGIMISGGGVAIDAVVADFIAGAAEVLSPDAPADHWDVIEGQGSLFHPAYAGVTTGLIHGSQPDVLILCHAPGRSHILSVSGYRLPSLHQAANLNLEMARLTNPAVRLAGISLNTSALSEDERERVIGETEREMQLPCFDPLKSSLDAIVDQVLS